MFKDNLKRIREERGLSQSELARRIGIDHAMVNRWEKGILTPNAYWLKDIAETLGVTADELLRDVV